MPHYKAQRKYIDRLKSGEHHIVGLEKGLGHVRSLAVVLERMSWQESAPECDVPPPDRMRDLMNGCGCARHLEAILMRLLNIAPGPEHGWL